MTDEQTQFDSIVPSLSEQLTRDFYRWERRGRGWQFWYDVVELEPVFEPFFYHQVPFQPAVDDGRRPTFFSSLLERLHGFLTGSSKTDQIFAPSTLDMVDEPEPVIFDDTSDLHQTTISLSPKQKVPLEYAEQFLLNLSSCSLPLSFEIIGTAESSSIQLVCREPDLVQVRQQLNAYFPDAVVYKGGQTLENLWDDYKHTIAIDFGLSQEFMRPLRTFKNLEPDPLTGIVAALENLDEGEMGIFQVLFQTARQSWAESILRSVTDWQGRSFFADSPETVHLAREKVERPLFAVVIRVVGQSRSASRAWEIARGLAGGLTQVANPQSNELIPLSNEGYDDSLHSEDVYYRQSRRNGMLLNSEELVCLIHPPSVSVRAAKLRRELKKTKAAPAIASGHQFVLGENVHQGQKKPVTLSGEQRLRHMHIIGATGTGKSTLLLKLIIQDIENGLGVGVLDPHGDLIDRILGYVPEERFDDVVLLDPSDSDYPVGLNILSAYSEQDKTVLSSDLVGVFRRLSTSWGDQMNSIFGNAILAFLESERGGTLMDLRSFLVEKDYRRSFLETVEDQDVIYYWQKVFPQLRGRLQAPILTRLDTFLRPKPIRFMVAQKEGLNFQSILDGRKIFLAKLAHGLIGVENAYLLGTIIASKFHQAAMARQAKSVSERENFYLYIDEFQNFVTESMTEILSGARKYNFGLVLAHQELRQLWSRDTELANSVISNPCTRICFRLGDFDAKKLEDGFSTFDAKDLQNLGVGEAIARIERAEYDFNLKTSVPPDISPELIRKRREEIINLSRDKYARPREQIGAEMAKAKTAISEKEPVPETQRPSFEEIKEEVKQEIIREPTLSYRRKKAKEELPALAGKGGQKHKYYQHLIRQTAEACGYRAMIEQTTEDGSGSVDVHLERDGKKIACEISVTSTDEQELGNIEKRLAAGYNQVILCSPAEKTLKKVKKLTLEKLPEAEREKLLFFSPEQTISYLKQQAAKGAGKEKWLKGRKVKVQFQPVEEEKEKTKLNAIGQVLAGSLRRLKGGARQKG